MRGGRGAIKPADKPGETIGVWRRRAEERCRLIGKQLVVHKAKRNAVLRVRRRPAQKLAAALFESDRKRRIGREHRGGQDALAGWRGHRPDLPISRVIRRNPDEGAAPIRIGDAGHAFRRGDAVHGVSSPW
jgi:hypothetical protein